MPDFDDGPAPRRIRADEAAAYRAARLRALSLAPDAYEATYEETLAIPAEEWAEIVAEAADSMANAIFVIDRASPVVGAVPDDSIAGTVFVRVNETPPYDTYIGAMWVDPDLRGGSAAQQLLGVAEAFAASRGSASCELWVEGDNVAARRLYTSCGYLETGVTVSGRRGVASHLMQKFLLGP